MTCHGALPWLIPFVCLNVYKNLPHTCSKICNLIADMLRPRKPLLLHNIIYLPQFLKQVISYLPTGRFGSDPVAFLLGVVGGAGSSWPKLACFHEGFPKTTIFIVACLTISQKKKQSKHLLSISIQTEK